MDQGSEGGRGEEGVPEEFGQEGGSVEEGEAKEEG